MSSSLARGTFFSFPFLKPPLPGSAIQSFDISAQGNGETCWGFTHSLPQTGCHYGNSTVDLSLNIFLEKCGLMHETPPPSLQTPYYVSPDAALCVNKCGGTPGKCQVVGICVCAQPWFVPDQTLMLIGYFTIYPGEKGTCNFNLGAIRGTNVPQQMRLRAACRFKRSLSNFIKSEYGALILTHPVMRLGNYQVNNAKSFLFVGR